MGDVAGPGAPDTRTRTVEAMRVSPQQRSSDDGCRPDDQAVLHALIGGTHHDIAENVRRRLAATKYAAQTGSLGDHADFAVQLACDEYRMFGGNPDDVAADWVFAFHPQIGWTPVPHTAAEFDLTTGRWTTNWDDPAAGETTPTSDTVTAGC